MLRCGGQHLQPAPGDRLPLNDLEVTVVSSAGTTLFGPLPAAGAITTACQEHAMAPRDPYENPRSTGIVIRYGKFRFLGVRDLSVQPLSNLACPHSLTLSVDAYLVAHHGGPAVDVPAPLAPFTPRIAL